MIIAKASCGENRVYRLLIDKYYFCGISHASPCFSFGILLKVSGTDLFCIINVKAVELKINYLMLFSFFQIKNTLADATERLSRESSDVYFKQFNHSPK